MLPKRVFIFCAGLVFIICPEVHSGLTAIDVPKPRATLEPDWWKNEVFYQIYPRSFKEDVTGNGIGNLIGIENKLQELKDMGITAIILAQILKSSGTEHSEAILDFRDVHPDYGTLVEFGALVSAAKILNIKIILDIVINHSGKETTWFINENVIQTTGKTEEDYYVWHKGTGTGADRKPPNNWLSVYGDSAWELAQPRDEYYLHQFGVDQPDLNFNNSKVIEEMKGVLEYWFNLEVDGIKLNGVPHLFEDAQWRDEPVIPGVEPYKYESLNHIYTKDQERTFDLIYDLRTFIDDYNKRPTTINPKILLCEAYTSIENTMKYYEGKGKQGAHIALNFQLMNHNKNSDAFQIVGSINDWLNKMPKNQTANWILGNQDHHRAATRFGPNLADSMNILIASLPGAMVTYNGEEIGQENGDVAYIQCKDPVGCRAGPAEFPKVSRDFQRTPYHWNAESNAGFTTGNPWLPVSEKYLLNNLAVQKVNPTEDTHYNNYRNMILERQKFKNGVKVEALSKYVIKITRGNEYNEYGNYVVLINIGGVNQKVRASEKIGQLYEVTHSTDASITKTQKIWARDVKIAAYKTIVFRMVSHDANYDWWKNAVIYQIYPRSFRDENNDGIGDLKGIISKLEYLKELGVNAICLASIYQSSQQDLGYDITNFEEIDEIYGTRKDLERLIQRANSHGIKVIMDFVPNHSSKDHPWFTDPAKKSYYVLKKLSTPQESLYNWLTIYKGNQAWTEFPGTTTNEYYLHQFDSTLPDLNYESLQVQTAIKNYLKSWLKIGVAGFRMTGVPYLYEDKTAFKKDEPRSNDPAGENDKWKSLRHVYTSNLSPTYDLIYDWRELLDLYTAEEGDYERILITEADTDIHNTMYYYGTQGRKGAHFTLNFQLVEKVNSSSNANDFAAVINEWVRFIPEGFTSNWVLGNHDKHRVATRFGPQNVDGFNMLAAILPGVMVTYNGEEIGQEDGPLLSSEECAGDPMFCPNIAQTAEEKEVFRKMRRDRQRTPFHWDNSTNAGFNIGTRSWLPISPDYTKNNLALQMKQNNSHYELYKRLTKLRRKPAFVSGSLKVKAVTDYVLASLRYHTPNESYFHLFNLGNNQETFSLLSVYNETTQFVEVIETSDPERLPIGTLLNANSTSLQGYQSVIAVFSTKVAPSSATIHVISSFVLLLGLLINKIGLH